MIGSIVLFSFNIRIHSATQQIYLDIPGWAEVEGLSSLLAPSTVVIIPGTVATVLWPLWPLWPLRLLAALLFALSVVSVRWRPLAISVMMHSISNGVVDGMVGSHKVSMTMVGLRFTFSKSLHCQAVVIVAMQALGAPV